MNNIAIAIPTFERPDSIEEIMQETMELYAQNHVYVYIYDSSYSNDTYNIISKYQLKYNNLFYVRMDSKLHVNEKIIDIYQQKGMNNNVDYVWLLGDGVRITEKILKDVLKICNNSFDMVLINFSDAAGLGNVVYDDANEVFFNCAWVATLFGAVIVNTEKMLKYVDWDCIRKKYLKEECINFSQIGIYFETVCKLVKLRVYHYSVTGREISGYKSKHCGWSDRAFFIMCESWYNAINNLPDYYKRKAEVIHNHWVYSGALSLRGFVDLRKRNQFNIETYNKYCKRWNEFCDINEEILKKLAENTPEESDIVLIDAISEYCKKYKKIYIYGCGKIADQFTDYMNYLNIDIEAYLVSELSEDIVHNGKDILQFDEQLLDNSDFGIIMAMGTENYWRLVNEKKLRKYKERMLFLN